MQSKGSKIGPTPDKIDITYYRKMFDQEKVTCEYPDMETGAYTCTNKAWHVYVTDWSMVFICTQHVRYIKTLKPKDILQVDLRIAQVMWGNFCRRSWVVMNTVSNGDLARRIEEQNRQDDLASARPERRKAAEQVRIKKEIAKQSVRIGAPDSSLVEARTGKKVIQKKVNINDDSRPTPVRSSDIPLFLPSFGG